MMGFAYVTLGTNDLGRARAFYASVVAALGGSIAVEVPDHAFCCSLPGDGKLWITRPFDGAPASNGNGAMIALACASVEIVDTGHAAGLQMGGTCEGAPGPRPIYGPDVYIGYLRDPDGNKLALAHYRDRSDP